MISRFGDDWPAEWLRRGGLGQWAEYVESERNSRQEVDGETLDLFAAIALPMVLSGGTDRHAEETEFEEEG